MADLGFDPTFKGGGKVRHRLKVTTGKFGRPDMPELDGVPLKNCQQVTLDLQVGHVPKALIILVPLQTRFEGEVETTIIERCRLCGVSTYNDNGAKEVDVISLTGDVERRFLVDPEERK